LNVPRFIFWVNAYPDSRLEALFRRASDDGWEDMKASTVLTILYFTAMLDVFEIIQLSLGYKLKYSIASWIVGIIACAGGLANLLRPKERRRSIAKEIAEYANLKRRLLDMSFALVVIGLFCALITTVEAARPLPG